MDKRSVTWWILGVIILVTLVEGVYYYNSQKTKTGLSKEEVGEDIVGTTSVSNIETKESLEVEKTLSNQKQEENDNSEPPLGKDTLKISCRLEEMVETCQPGDTTKKSCSTAMRCNTEGVNTWRSDFYLTNVDGRKIKILIDSETRLRYVAGDPRSSDANERVQKWADFYPLIDPYTPEAGGMPFGATIYGDWMDESTLKANWIKWSIG